LPGYTLMGIQTATYYQNRFWFGCYGDPRTIICTDKKLKIIGSYEIDGSLGIAGIDKAHMYLGLWIPDSGLGALRTIETSKINEMIQN